MSTKDRRLSMRRDSVAASEQLKEWKIKFQPFVVYLLGTLASIDFVMIVIGSIYYRKCPAGPRIPLFLIVLGVIGILGKMATQLKSKCESRRDKLKYVESLLHTTAFVLIISGSIWTYRIYKPSYNEDDKIYCNKICYLFSFIYVTTVYSLLLLVILLVFCAFLLTLCLSGCDKKEDENA